MDSGARRSLHQFEPVFDGVAPPGVAEIIAHTAIIRISKRGNFFLLLILKSANYAEASEAESPADFIHKLKVAQKELKESRVWLLFASRLSPGDAVEGLRAESRELLLMIGKSINTATARIQGKAIGA